MTADPIPPSASVPSEKSTTPACRSWRFKIGILFLVINTPFGYGAAFLAVAIGAALYQPKLGAAIGVGLYILSWGMLGLGIWMAGPEGIRIAKEYASLWRRPKDSPPTTPP